MPTTTPSLTLKQINLSRENDTLAYWGAQVMAPDNYFATDDIMLSNYDSQGGMAPPRVILMKNHQILNDKTTNYYEQLAKSQKDDCISIWTTMSMGKDPRNALDAWNADITQLKGQLVDKENIEIGNRTAQIYKMIRKEGDVYVGLLQIGDKGDTSYYFKTCNVNNKTDFVNVIKSLKLRADINFN